MHEDSTSVGYSMCKFIGGQRGSERHVSSREGLTEAQYVWVYYCIIHIALFIVFHSMIAAPIISIQRRPRLERLISLPPPKQRPSPSKASGNLIKYQQHIVLIAQFSHFLQHNWMIEFHPSRTLHYRFHDHGRHFLMMPLQHTFHFLQCFHRIRRTRTSRRGYEELICQGSGKHGMHPVHRVADAHGTKGIAVIAIAKRNEFGLFGMLEGEPILNSHFHRHLD
mmetsp:Transcript_17774/g.38392  ORF Transcript_17774/g.38392 Transcript_17774/m.38392 type:complete len:223 (+) Transcript_17774:465-1133(+)